MGIQASDPTTHNSSIALLQERFRQLQRAKEKREEMELLKLLSETVRLSPPTYYYYEPFFKGESCPQGSQSQHSSKLQPCLVFVQKDDAENKKKLYSADDLWSKDIVMHRRIVVEHFSDVDTSLHL